MTRGEKRSPVTGRPVAMIGRGGTMTAIEKMMVRTRKAAPEGRP